MIEVKCAVSDVIELLNNNTITLKKEFEANILKSLFAYVLDFPPANDSDLIVAYIKSYPTLIRDFMDYASKKLEAQTMYKSDWLYLDQIYYLTFSELILQQCDDELLVCFLNTFTCLFNEKSQSKDLNADCWNTLLSYELRDMINYNLEEYKLVNYQAKKIVLINKALSILFDN